MRLFRQRRWTVVCAIVVLPSILISGALGFGVRVPGLGVLPHLPFASPLDYLSRPDGLAPLSARFISQVLGVGAEKQQSPRERVMGQTVADGSFPVAGQGLTDEHPLTNDDMASARKVPTVPFTAKTDTRKATREADEPDNCSQVGESTVWYWYRAARNTGLTANTFGTNFSTTLGVFRGRPGSLSRVGCDTDARGNSIVPFAAKAGSTFYFQITGLAGGGDLVFNLDGYGKISRVWGQPNGEVAAYPSISGDGRFVAFQACPGSGLPCRIIVRDRLRSRATLVSVDSSGREANDGAWGPFISGNGRFVAFQSAANNLVPHDTNNAADIFVHDLVARQTERVSVSSSGEQLRQPSPHGGSEEYIWATFSPTLSWDGRYAAFQSSASNLVPRDTNGVADVFVHDRVTGRTERVSVTSRGKEQRLNFRSPTRTVTPDSRTITLVCSSPTSPCLDPSISGSGRFVAFQSLDALAPGDTNHDWDLYVRDRVTHRTERVSMPEIPGQPDGGVDWDTIPHQSLSFDGRYVTWTSSWHYVDFASPTRRRPHVYVRDRVEGRTIEVSVSSTGEPASNEVGPSSWLVVLGATQHPSMSADGRYVVYHSDAANLAPGAANSGVDVFLHDLVTRTTLLVSAEPGAESARNGGFPAISADGRVIAFNAGDFAVDPNINDQVYVFERPRGSG